MLTLFDSQIVPCISFPYVLLRDGEKMRLPLLSQLSIRDTMPEHAAYVMLETRRGDNLSQSPYFHTYKGLSRRSRPPTR